MGGSRRRRAWEGTLGFGDAIKHCFSNYVNFTGRALRSEYWFWILGIVIISVVLSIIDNAVIGTPVLGSLFSLATLLPGIAVGVRRLHDTDRSGWWLLLAFIPLIGAIILIVWFATEGIAGPNRFGGPAPTKA
jgi:uncharacterized membrane protein YhaH (DUF805 family)